MRQSISPSLQAASPVISPSLGRKRRSGAEPRAAAGAVLQFTSALTLHRSMAGISNGISHPDKGKVILDISTGNSNANRPLIVMTFFHTHLIAIHM